MREILLVLGSGVKGGNTDRLADAFIRGCEQAGHTVHKVFLGDGLSGCRGCGACQVDSGKGCILADKMQEIYPLFARCDTVVLASPLYFWTISASLKAFIERLYAVSKGDEYPHKDSFLLMTAGDDSFWTFEMALSYYRFAIGAIGWSDLGSCLAGGCSGKPGHHSIEERHLQKAFAAGAAL